MIHIFLAANESFAQHLGVVMTSILHNAKPDTSLSFHILSAGISAVSKQKLAKLRCLKEFEIEYIDIEQGIFSDLESHRYSTIVYYRLLIPRLAPHLDKAIYLDADIVVRDDLTELWETVLAGFALGVVEDVGLSMKRLKSFGVSGEGRYFNTGVQVMNLVQLREMDVVDQAIAFVKRHHSELKYADQDVFNVLLEGKVMYLHPKWNQQKGVFLHGHERTAYPESWYLEARRDPAIVHFTTAEKPWLYKSKHKFKHEYWKYLALTEWKKYRPSDFTLRNFLSKIFYRLLDE